VVKGKPDIEENVPADFGHHAPRTRPLLHFARISTPAATNACLLGTCTSSIAKYFSRCIGYQQSALDDLRRSCFFDAHLIIFI
jgi:hypothetical protein